MTSMLEHVRALGITMGSIHVGQHIGYTTDPEKAEAARHISGFVTTEVETDDGETETVIREEQPDAWDISFPVGADV